MKKLLLSATVVAGLFAAPTVDSLQQQINQLQQQLKDLKAKQTEQNSRYYKNVAPIVANNHLFWNYDLRTTFDAISEKTTGGPAFTVTGNPDGTVTMQMTGQNQNKTFYGNQIFTNRVILTGVYKPSDSLKATVKIEANNIFGMQAETNYSPYQNVPWVANETPDDNTIRLKEAYFNYFFGDDMMFSAGRRPATNGYPANLRENDDPASPLAHLINMEFDGFSFKIGNGEFSNISDKFSDWGTWLKFCAGRGYSSSAGKWPYDFSPAYSSTDEKDGLKNMDFAGFIFVPYDDGQYALWTETVWAWHVQGYGYIPDQSNPATGTFKYGMADFGGYFGENVILKADGIGDGISDFLDDTKAFVSFALSKTQGVKQLPIGVNMADGSTITQEGHTGRSIWVGADMPAGDNSRIGLNFVSGSKYWRSFTYGEDTLVGSIAAVRGRAYEVYYNTEIVPHLTAGVRYTLINYDHAGSDGFFGMMMDPDYADAFGYVKTARDFRAYIRYNF